MTKFPLDVHSDQSKLLLSHMFEAKRVPLDLLDLIPNYREFHRRDFPAVLATVKSGVQLKEFDFYFDFVLALANDLRVNKG